MIQKYVHPVIGFLKTDNVNMVTLYSDKVLKYHSGKVVTYYNINAPPW